MNVLFFLASPVDVRRRSTELHVEYARPSSAGEEEIQLQLALAMSKEEHEEELKKQKSDDVKLALALEESRKQVDEVSTLFTQSKLHMVVVPYSEVLAFYQGKSWIDDFCFGITIFLQKIKNSLLGFINFLSYKDLLIFSFTRYSSLTKISLNQQYN